MKIIVIGLGSMGKRRIRLLKSIYPNNTIFGVDNNEDRVTTVSKEYGIVCFTDSKEIKEKKEINCAFVCTAPSSHHTIINECLRNGWNVFTEINLIEDGYQENIQLAKEKKLLLFLSSTPLYRTEMKRIDALVKENGHPLNYNYHVGQYLPDWHPWENFTQFFVNNKRTNGCREIFAIELPWMIKTFGAIHEVQVTRHKITQLQIDYNDSYFVRILHQNGNCGILAVDVVCRQAIRHLEIYNEHIFIEWNGTPETLNYKNSISNQMQQIDIDSEYARENGYSNFVNEYAYVNEIKEFFEVLETGKEMQYSFEEDAAILKIIDEIEGI